MECFFCGVLRLRRGVGSPEEVSIVAHEAWHGQTLFMRVSLWITAAATWRLCTCLSQKGKVHLLGTSFES